MALTPEEQEQIRDRIRRDLEASRERGKNPSDPRRVEQFNQDESYLQQVERLRHEVEDEYFSQQPDYVQYVNRYGVTKWVLEEELHQKREKSRQRRENKHRIFLAQVRRVLLYILVIMAVAIGYKAYKALYVPPVVLLRANIDTPGMVFVNTALSGLHANEFGNMRPGQYNIGIAAPGYRTMFKMVTVKSQDTTYAEFRLIQDSLFNPDNYGLWRRHFPPPRPDEPVVLTQLRKLNSPEKRVETTAVPDTSHKVTAQSATGGVFITSNQPDATIYLNDAPTPLPQNTLLSDLPLGVLKFEIRKPGFRSNPTFLTTNRTNPNERTSLAFELVSEHTAKISIRTEPIIGEIKLDGVAVGRGTITQEPGIGTHTISFSDVPGFITPPNQILEISNRSSEQEIVGRYRATIDLEIRVDESGRVKTRGIINIQTGYWSEEKGEVPTMEYGPEIVKIKPYDFYVYQFGPGRPNSNPSGSDYLAITFNLPPGFDSDRPLSLVLEGYATNRNFQFNLSKLTEIAIEVNGQMSQANIRPSVNIDETRTVARDAYPISRFLKAGANRVMIRLTDNSKCYYLLRGMKIE